MSKPGARGLRRLLHALRYSFQGLLACWRHEASFRLEAQCSVVLLPLALLLGGNGIERALLAGSWLLVLTLEILNSGIEAVVDRIGPERDPLSGRAKDLGSAAVFLAMLTWLLTWGLILLG